MVPEKYASIKSPADLDNLPTTVIVSIYNSLAGKDIKAFHTRAKGIEQTWKVLDEQRRAKAPVAEESPAPVAEESPAPVAEESPPPPKAVAPTGIRQSKNDPDHIIKVLVTENPKSRPTSRAYQQTAILMKFDGRPARDFLAEEGKHPELDDRRGWARSELAYAIRVQHVSLTAPEESA